jgi:hypothetical protein
MRVIGAKTENLPWSFLKIKGVDFFPAFPSWFDFHFLDTSAIQSRSAVFSRSPLGRIAWNDNLASVDPQAPTAIIHHGDER